MSKCVLLSIRPQWCELIANGKKTIEVRKTRPKLETPFKCYIYCTIGGDALCPPHMNSPKWDIHRQGNGTAKGRKMTAIERDKSDYRFANGKVIGEFVCDKMYGGYYSICPHDPPVFEEIGTLNRPNVMGETCLSAIELNDYLDGETGYGWHISALQIYDKPRELSEFTKFGYDSHMPCCRVKRPFQSWGYIEEVEELK